MFQEALDVTECNNSNQIISLGRYSDGQRSYEFHNASKKWFSLFSLPVHHRILVFNVNFSILGGVSWQFWGTVRKGSGSFFRSFTDLEGLYKP